MRTQGRVEWRGFDRRRLLEMEFFHRMGGVDDGHLLFGQTEE